MKPTALASFMLLCFCLMLQIFDKNLSTPQSTHHSDFATSLFASSPTVQSCNIRCMNGGSCAEDSCSCTKGYTGNHCGQRKWKLQIKHTLMWMCDLFILCFFNFYFYMWSSQFYSSRYLAWSEGSWRYCLKDWCHTESPYKCLLYAYTIQYVFTCDPSDSKVTSFKVCRFSVSHPLLVCLL